jgi:hypothetical protein
MAERLPERIVAVERIGVSSVSAQERHNRNKQNSVSELARVYVEQIAPVNRNVASKSSLLHSFLDGAVKLLSCVKKPSELSMPSCIDRQWNFPPVSCLQVQAVSSATVLQNPCRPMHSA